jgi:hypothetical protein
VVHVYVLNFPMDVVDQIEEDEVVEDPVVDHLDQENLLVHTMFATNVEVYFHKNLSTKTYSLIFEISDRGHYAYDCEIRLRRQRRMR